jgi:hypothetical protein
MRYTPIYYQHHYVPRDLGLVACSDLNVTVQKSL